MKTEELTCFLAKQPRQRLNYYSGGSVVSRAFFFFFCLIVLSLSVSALEDVSLSRAITLLTQDLSSKQAVVLFNQNFIYSRS